jgi:ubiquinone/menaquinone biosynthesis C-methylase UbiE
MASPTDHKQAAIEQWTADPCGSSVAEGEPGSRSYFEDLLRARHEYAPWMTESLGYAQAGGLDVLDVGSGQGIDLYHYAANGARATGIDLTPRHCELAAQHLGAMGQEATVVNGDAEQLPFEDASFDRVSSNGVLHHTPDMPAALREIRRVLRPGGEARVIVYNHNSAHYWINQFLYQGIIRRGLLEERSMEGVLSRGVEYSSIGARPLVRVYSPKQMRHLMTEAGFAGASTTVRHFRTTDTFITHLLAGRIAALRNPKLLDRIGRAAGWYVVARGSRPA